MFETLLRPMDVSSTPSLPSIDDVTARLKAAEVKREDKRLRQIAQNREREAKEALAKGSGEAGTKRKQGETRGEGDEAGGDSGEVEKKRAKTTTDADEGEAEMQVDGDPPAIPVISTTPITLSQVLASVSVPSVSPTPIPVLPSTSTPAPTTTPTPVPSSSRPPAGKISVSKALPEVRGHTSYLTFATLVPYAYAQKLKSNAAEVVQSSQETTNRNKAAEVAQSEEKGEGRVVSGPSASWSHATSAEPGEKAASASS
jgi:tRNA (adenine57-N1/adenine58-N1)-methyltransferase